MRTLLVFLVLVIVFSVTTPASADIAPPANPPGFNPAPGDEQTQVRMEAETVRMEILAASSGDKLGRAKVQASFSMKNLGTANESMAVRFPAAAGDGWSHVVRIENISIKVDGKAIQVREISGEDPWGFEKEVPWVEFDIQFPAGKIVTVEVAYTLKATGEFPYAWYTYVFSTGAAWKGTIGSADMIVTFPYEVEEVFLLPCGVDDFNCTRQGGEINGKTITWEYRDFEPGVKDNFSIAIVAPSYWSQVLEARARVAANPKDGESWGKLGKLYKELIFSPHGKRGFRSWEYNQDPGINKLFQMSDEAYTKAITLLPEDAQWRAGYADLLAYYAVFAGDQGEATLPLKIKSLEQLHRALQLAPGDEIVRGIAEDLTWMMEDGIVEQGDGFDFPWLTQTPEPTATLAGVEALTDTVEPTVTAASTPQATPPTSELMDVTETPAAISGGKSKPPLCASALLFPFMLIIGVKRWRAREERRSL